jgi:3-hydroxyisobutyrate dehydrogenase-like beta-hydroxyacid dehydrogenase
MAGMRGATIGLLHPGEMGAAIGRVLRESGYPVVWAAADRSTETAQRAEAAGLRDVGTVAGVADESDVILSVCPPHAAEEVASAIAGFDGIYVDANAVSPDTTRAVADAAKARSFVDGGIVGSPPTETGATRLYLSGSDADDVAEVFEGTLVDARVIPGEIGAASAMKMVYAAWTKGTAALLLAIRAAARAEGIEATLVGEWQQSLPELVERSERAAMSAARKGWRWDYEMEEIASTFASAGLPDGFHRAAADVFRRAPRLDDATLEDVLTALARQAAQR